MKSGMRNPGYNIHISAAEVEALSLFVKVKLTADITEPGANASVPRRDRAGADRSPDPELSELPKDWPSNLPPSRMDRTELTIREPKKKSGARNTKYNPPKAPAR